MESTSRKMIDEYKANPSKAIEQLEFCGYECEGGILVNNVAKDSFRVILAEDSEYYYIQENLHTLDKFRLTKRDNGVLFQVVERS